MCSLSLLIAHSAPSFLFFHPIPTSFLSPRFTTSESRHHFSFLPLSLPRYSRISSVIHLSYSLVSGFFDSLPSSLLVCVFVSFTQLYIHPSSFCSQSFHFLTGIPVPLVVFLCLLFLHVQSSTVAERLAHHFAFGRSRVLTPVPPDLVWVFFRGFPTPSHHGMSHITDKENAGSVYQPFSTYHLPSAPILTVPIPNLPVSVTEKALESLSSPPPFGRE
jgi:hypothetical protein